MQTRNHKYRVAHKNVLDFGAELKTTEAEVSQKPLSPEFGYKIGRIPPLFPLDVGPLRYSYGVWGAL